MDLTSALGMLILAALIKAAERVSHTPQTTGAETAQVFPKAATQYCEVSPLRPPLGVHT